MRQTVTTTRTRLFAVIASAALFVCLLAAGCGDDPSMTTEPTPVETQTTSGETQGQTPEIATEFFNGSCTGTQSSTVDNTQATATCNIQADLLQGTIVGDCELTNYACAGSGTIENASMDLSTGSCSYTIDYGGTTIQYDCLPQTLDLANSTIDLQYMVTNQDSPCAGDAGVLQQLACSDP